MKTIINKILLFVMLFAGAVSLHGCSDPDGIIEDIAYDREFSPLNFTYTLTNNVNVAFSWTVMTGISDYTLTLSYTDGEGGVYDEVDLIAPLDGDGTTVKTMDYSFKELPGNREWKAELVAVSQRTGVSDSKPAVCLFATGIENLFLNDGKVSDEDITATTALLRWVAGSNVTGLNVTPGIGKVALTADQIAAGEYELTGLTTGTAYTVELLRDEAVRGTVTFVASDKIDVDVTDKSASAITLSWGADRQVTGLVLKDRCAHLYLRRTERAHGVCDFGLHRRCRVGQSGRHDAGTVQFLGFHRRFEMAGRQLGVEPDHRRSHDPGRLGQKRPDSGRCRLRLQLPRPARQIDLQGGRSAYAACRAVLGGGRGRNRHRLLRQRHGS